MRTYPNMLVLIVAAALMFTSCIGDLSVRVAIRNATDAPVILYELGRERPQFRVRLAPGDTRNTGFMYRRKESAQILAQVEATDEAGNLIFCRTYTYQDIERPGHKIDIVKGDLQCS